MIRYLTISLFIHLLFVVLLNFKKYDVIENPIIAVEFFEPTSTKTSKNSTTAVKKLAAPQKEKQQQQPELSASQSTEPAAVNDTLTQGPSGALSDLQQVTKLPRVLKQVKAEYPETARQARIEGAVRLAVIIDTNGNVNDVQVLDGPGHGLNETAQKALMNFRFSPAEKQGEKVSVKITYIYRFRLDSR